MARLERALAYRRLALIELAAQMAFYLVALTLAYRGLGVWAPIGGWWVAELLRLGLFYRVSAYRDLGSTGSRPGHVQW